MTDYLRVPPKAKRVARDLARAGQAIERSSKGAGYENLDLLRADFTRRIWKPITSL